MFLNTDNTVLLLLLYFSSLVQKLGVVTVQQLQSSLLYTLAKFIATFNRRYLALNTNKWNDKKVAQPNIQKW